MATTKVQSEHIAINAISGTIIADNAITSVHIAQNAILTKHIDDGQVGTAQLAADAVTGAKLADSSVVTANIQDDQVTGDKLTDNITIAGTLGVTGVLSPTTHIDMPDNAKIKLGTGDDLEIYHDGTDSYIHDSGSGNLELRTNGTHIGIMGNDGAEYMGKFVQDGAVTLYYDNAAKLATVTGGINVTGDTDTDTLTVSGNATVAGTLGITGDVGIGTTTLSQTFNIKDTGSYVDMSWEGSARKWVAGVRASDSNFYIYDNNAAAFRLSIDTSGNVGIGDTSPARALSTKSSSVTVGSFESTSASGGMIGFVDSNTTNDVTVRAGALGNDLVLQAGGSTRMRIDAQGYVGVGVIPESSAASDNSGIFVGGLGGLWGKTTAAAAKHTTLSNNVYDHPSTGQAAIVTDEGAKITLTNGTILLATTPAATTADAAHSWNTGVNILANGNVGIGETSPDARLHVYTTGYPAGKFERYGSSTATRGWTQIGHSAMGYSGSTGADSYIIAQHGFGFAVNEGTNAMTITDGGKVGIGTTNPAGALDLQSDGYGTWPFYVRRSANGAQLAGIYESSQGDGGHGMLYLMDGGGTTDVKLSTNGVSWMNGGNVGIGLTDPSYPLEVQSNSSAQGINIRGRSDHIAELNFTNNAGNDVYSQIQSHSTSFQLKALHDIPMIFKQNNTEVMRIADNTCVGISETTPQYTLEVGNSSDKGWGVNLENNTAKVYSKANSSNNDTQTHYQFSNNTGGVGSITTVSSSTSYNTSSDYRLKENVTYSWDATTRLKQLKPCRFNWIVDETDTLEDGFLAHEVSSVVTNAIIGDKDAVDADENPEYQQIDQGKLVPLLVKTIQELEARITALEG